MIGPHATRCPFVRDETPEPVLAAIQNPAANRHCPGQSQRKCRALSGCCQIVSGSEARHEFQKLFSKPGDRLGHPLVALDLDLNPAPLERFLLDPSRQCLGIAQHNGVSPPVHVGSKPMRIVEPTSLLLRRRPADRHQGSVVYFKPVVRSFPDHCKIEVRILCCVSCCPTADHSDRLGTLLEKCIGEMLGKTQDWLQRSSAFGPGSAKPNFRYRSCASSVCRNHFVLAYGPSSTLKRTSSSPRPRPRCSSST